MTMLPLVSMKCGSGHWIPAAQVGISHKPNPLSVQDKPSAD
jgi:hypothetical protein